MNCACAHTDIPPAVLTGFDGFGFLARARVYTLVHEVGLDTAVSVVVFEEDAECEGNA